MPFPVAGDCLFRPLSCSRKIACVRTSSVAPVYDLLRTAADIELNSKDTPISQPVAARAYERTSIFSRDIPGKRPRA